MSNANCQYTRADRTNANCRKLIGSTNPLKAGSVHAFKKLIVASKNASQSGLEGIGT